MSDAAAPARGFADGRRLANGSGDASFAPMLEFSTAAVAYCVFVGAVFLGLWIYYDRRDHRRFEAERRKTTFHCIRCDAIYPAAQGTQVCRCPKCGHENVRLRF